ncbi:MAG: sulfite exporter TauE/SafE family protein [bacterium]|nr:sulfite exporter TauE/SafE family protein [bacterium]
MITILLTVFVTSLLGSLHCAGMCGPFVVFYAGADSSSGWRRLPVHAVYSSGRFVAYILLGAIAGAVGAAIEVAGVLAGLQHVAAIVAGTTMIVWGIVALLRIRGLQLINHSKSPRLQTWLLQGFAVVSKKPPLVRALGVGILSGVLPCGWLWMFLVAAAGTGSALNGILVMAAFWAGTVPILVATGLGVQLAAAPLRRAVPSLTAVLLVAMGIFAIFSRPASVTAALATHEAMHNGTAEGHTPDEVVDMVEGLVDMEKPCCTDPPRQP